MSSKFIPPHLTTGSERPVMVDDKLRLYSMEYCPYAQRVRLVLIAKGVPHDIVNINLTNKPQWYFDIHPEGKVPALDTGSEVVVESLIIANYLDEKYPKPALYPAEPHARDQDEALIAKIGPMTDIYTKLIYGQEKKSAQEWLNEFKPHLDIFENALDNRKSGYFGGAKPGMIDYMLWPWAERVGIIPIILGEKLPLTSDQYCLLRNWKKEMRKQPSVDAIYQTPEKFHKVLLFKSGTVKPDYDSI